MKFLCMLFLFLISEINGRNFYRPGYYCRPPIAQPHVHFLPRRSVYHPYMRVFYQCDNDKMVYTGPLEAICIHGQFDLNPGTCVEPQTSHFCGVQETTPKNGFVYQSGEESVGDKKEFKEKEIVMFGCDDGFRVTGHVINICTKNGWAFPKAACKTENKDPTLNGYSDENINLRQSMDNNSFNVNIRGATGRVKLRVNGRKLY